LSRLAAAIGRQLHYPSGLRGRLIAATMGVANRRSNRVAIKAIEVKPGELVLELGCGSGHAIQALDALRSAKCVFGIDHSETMIERAARLNSAGLRKNRVRLLRGRIDALPLRDNSVDKILAVHVVYFADANAIREARRVLRAGGRMILVATDRTAMLHWHLEDSHRLYDAPALARLFAEGGFAAREVTITPITLAPGVRGLLAIAVKASPAKRE
jgi:ubiquinone/menaquinone biosynthesis C-methylase UbiE